MAKSKLLAISGLVLALVLALTCGLVFTVGSNPSTDANAAASHTDHEGWTDLNSYGSTTLASGKYYLSADFTGNLTLASYAKVVLCLNGYKLTGTGSGSVITVKSDQQLTLEDCNTTTEHQYYIDATGLWKFDDGTDGWDTAYAEAGAEKQGVVKGGVITGGNFEQGGGVYADSNSLFTMNGGTISGNTATAFGGGVFVNALSNFTLKGGSISGNTAINGGGVDAFRSSVFTIEGGTISDNSSTGEGGGVFASEESVVSMTGGAIKGNTTDSHGGGIYMEYNVNFTMDGGTISGNKALESGGGIGNSGGNATINAGTITGNTENYGGAMYVGGGMFTMTGGTINSNTTDSLYVSYRSFIEITGGKLSGTISIAAESTLRITGGSYQLAELSSQKVGTDTAEGEKGMSVFDGYEVVTNNVDHEYPYTVQKMAPPDTVVHEETDGWYALSTWIDRMGMVLNDGKYFVDKDITLTGALSIEGEVTLCLNGNKLVVMGNGNTRVITVNSGYSFTLQDCNTASRTHDYYVDSTGLWVFNNGQEGWDTAYSSAETKGSVNGGLMTGGKNYDFSGGVYVDSNATFTMNGGTISGNSSTDVYYGGGGVYVGTGSTFVMNDGTISGNTSTRKIGGGVFVDGSSFTMNGGTISNNTAATDGGGVMISGNGGIFTMLDGVISNNTAAANGGGVATVRGGAFYMEGGTITSNIASTSGTAINLNSTTPSKISDGKIGGTIVDSGSLLQIIGGRFNFANTTTQMLGTDTAEGENGVSVYSGYEVIKDDLDAEYPYLVQQLAPPATVEHEGTNDWYALSTWIDKMGNVLLSGKYFVDKDITVTNSLIIDGEVTLCLNGNKLAASDTSRVIYVNSGAAFTLEDCSATSTSHNYYVDSEGKYVFNNGQDGWDAAYGSAAIKGSVSGGVITGGYYTTGYASGGGLYISSNATFVMSGGTISGNRAYSGGGLYLGGTATMNGGTISGNRTSEGGGAIKIDTSATFTMNNGTISGNNNPAGAVEVDGTFIMYDGTISNNIGGSRGGGVFVRGTFVMNGGSISGNTSTGDGGGVYGDFGTFTFNNGTISANEATNGGGVYLKRVVMDMYGGTIADNTATTANGIYLAESSARVTIADGYIKDTIDNSKIDQINIAGGYFVDGDTEKNTVQGFGVGDSTVVPLTSDDAAYALGYRYKVEFIITLRIENLGNSQYDGLAISNKEDFTVLVKMGSVESPDYDFTFQYAPQGTEDFVDGLPSEIGKYTIKVSIVYLGETVEQQFDFEITKRTLSVSGLTAISRPYDGTTTVQLSGNLVGAFDGDDVQLVLGTGTIESADVGNGKPVTYELALTGADMDKYALPQSTDNIYVNITPKQIQVNWSATEFQFNGAIQQPVATVETGVEGETLTLTTTASDSIYVGDWYTASATMETPNSNYVLVGSEITYSIVRKVLTVDWSFTEIEYNGALQQPTATADTGIDGYTVFLTVTADQSVNVGKYTASVVIEGESAYFVLADEQFSYSIVPKALTVDWGNATFTYNGKVQVPTVASVEQGFEGQTFTVNVTVDGGVNAGKHTATATIVNTDPNYTLANATHEYTIAKAKVEVQWGTTEFKVDGNVHTPSATAVGVDGRTIVLQVEGGQSNVGSYTATATTTDGNYELTNASVNFTIVSNPNAVALGVTIGGTAVAGGIAVAVIAILLKRKKHM